MNVDVLKLAIDYIEANLDEAITVKDVCKYVNYSARQLDRMFVDAYEITVTRYIKMRKTTMALERISKADIRIDAAANSIQYDIASFSRIVRSNYGQRPRDFKSGLEGVDLFRKADIEYLQNIIKRLEITLRTLQSKGILKYKISASKKNVTIKKLNHGWLYSYLMSRPVIPVPAVLIDGLYGYGDSDKAAVIIACCYYQLEKNGFNKKQVVYDFSCWNSIIENDSQRLEEMISEVEVIYDIEHPVLDENNLLWYHVKSEFRKKLLEVIGRNVVKGPSLHYSVTKDDFIEFAEVAYEANLIKIRGNEDGSEMFLDFNARILLDIINAIGQDISLPKINVQNLELKESIVFLLALNKEINKALSNGLKFEKSEDELKMRFFIVSNFFNIEKPFKGKINYKYKINVFVLDVLDSLCEIENVTSEKFPFSYKIIQEKDKLILTLADPFRTLYIEEKIVK
jgi:AraC-like DNA-binding protein